MTTRPCPDCTRPTSPLATACPHCGRPLAVMPAAEVNAMVEVRRKNRRTVWILALLLLGGCTVWISTQDSEPRSDETGMTLSEAYCSDLRSGMNPAFIIPTDDGTTPERAAQMAYGYVSKACPEALENDERLRSWLGAWGLVA